MLVYIDDILIFSKTFEEHLTHLQNVFDKLRAARLRLHPKKCNIMLSEIQYLGHILTPEGVKVDEKKIDVIRKYPAPRTVKQVRSFLGYCGYYGNLSEASQK